MEPFTRLCGPAAPIEGRNIDTDQIIPARFLKADRAKGYGQFFFRDARFGPDGRERPDFVLNREPFRNARIVVSDDNFGCGSSREGAVYALYDFGVRSVIAPSFGDIFYNNCLKNGVVPVQLDREIVTGLLDQLKDAARPELCVDLDKLEVVLPDGSRHAFAIDAFWRECLMKGVDEIELTLGYIDRIGAFERDYRREMTWLGGRPEPVSLHTRRDAASAAETGDGR